MKLRVGIITENFPPCKGGGIAEWANGVANSLLAAGHDVTIILKHKPDTNYFEIYKNTPLDFQIMKGKPWREFKTLFVWRALKSMTKSNQGWILIATSWELAIPMLWMTRLNPKLAFIVVAHGLEITRKTSKLTQWLLDKVINRSLVTVAVSRFTQSILKSRVDEKNLGKVEFIPNGVDISRFYPTQPPPDFYHKYNIPKNKKIVLTLARVIERKGQDLVIKALPAVLKNEPDVFYVIAGPWREPYYQTLQLLIQELGLQDYVGFTGYIDQNDVIYFYNCCHVYVMTSRVLKSNNDSEGFGITFLEANACEKPVIGSNSGGIPDAIEDGISGFLIEEDNEAELADRLIKILGNDDLRTQLGIQGRERVEKHFQWSALTDRLLTIAGIQA